MPNQPRPSRRRRLIALATGCVLAAALAAILYSSRPSSSPAVSTGGATLIDTAEGIDSSGAALMQLSVVASGHAPLAPGLDLVDQNGRRTTLSQFRGKVVIWSLNDDQCTDMCALFAQDVVAAEKDLGPASEHVVFLSVNANPFYPAPAAVKAWSVRNNVESLPNWVYLTGSPAELEKTWAAYQVTVIQDTKNKTVQHDPIVEFIDPDGRTRAFGYFDQGALSTANYAHTMAQMADDLLPKSEQVKVGGPTVSAPTTRGAAIGEVAPAFDLRSVTTPTMTSLAEAAKRPLVLNFWSSTCSICAQEMPALQQVFSDYGGAVDVVGVDVADPSSAAASFPKSSEPATPSWPIRAATPPLPTGLTLCQ